MGRQVNLLSPARRTAVRLWFHPKLFDLPTAMRAAFVKRCDRLPPDWPVESSRLYESLVIR